MLINLESFWSIFFYSFQHSDWLPSCHQIARANIIPIYLAFIENIFHILNLPFKEKYKCPKTFETFRAI